MVNIHYIILIKKINDKIKKITVCHNISLP